MYFKDATIGEKVSALIVANTMKLKRKFGIGVKSREKTRKEPVKRKFAKKLGIPYFRVFL